DLRVSSIHSALSAALSTLNPWSSRLFKRLWIFEGSVDADSVEMVCVDPELPKTAILDSLKDLFEAHLIAPSQRGPSKRSFRLSQISREYSRSFVAQEDRKA